MLAKEFIRSPEARLSDFTTSCRDAPVVAQFGGKSPLDFARASEMIAPYVDGVSLNCGCPQSWALAEGVGCALMAKPELVKEMVLAVKKRCPGLSVGVKIRVHKDIEETVRWVKIVEGSGVDYVTVHGRMRSQMGKGPVDYAKIKRIKETLKCPVVVNGGITSLEDERRVLELTGCDGECKFKRKLNHADGCRHHDCAVPPLQSLPLRRSSIRTHRYHSQVSRLLLTVTYTRSISSSSLGGDVWRGRQDAEVGQNRA